MPLALFRWAYTLRSWFTGAGVLVPVLSAVRRWTAAHELPCQHYCTVMKNNQQTRNKPYSTGGPSLVLLCYLPVFIAFCEQQPLPLPAFLLEVCASSLALPVTCRGGDRGSLGSISRFYSSTSYQEVPPQIPVHSKEARTKQGHSPYLVGSLPLGPRTSPVSGLTT